MFIWMSSIVAGPGLTFFSVATWFKVLQGQLIYLGTVWMYCSRLLTPSLSEVLMWMTSYLTMLSEEADWILQPCCQH